MALLAESLVDEWLNRAGFFTVRGIKHGVEEIDLLGVRPCKEGLEAWHVEVQASFRPISYITPLPADMPLGFAKSRKSAKVRPPWLLEKAVTSWVDSKFKSKAKHEARQNVWRGLEWKFVFVHAVIKYDAEVVAIAQNGVEVIPLFHVLSELRRQGASGIRGSAGTDLSEIIVYFSENVGKECLPGS